MTQHYLASRQLVSGLSQLMITGRARKGKLLHFLEVQSGPQPRTWRDMTQLMSHIGVGVRYVWRPVAKRPLTSGRWGASRERRKASLSKFSLDYQEFKSKPKIQAESQAAADVESVLRIVVGKEEPTGAVVAHRIEAKGPTDEWIVRRLVKDIEELGRGDIIVKTDGEPAMIAFKRAIAVLRKDQVTKPKIRLHTIQNQWGGGKEGTRRQRAGKNVKAGSGGAHWCHDP